MTKARRIYLEVYYQGKNISKEINSDLLEFSHNDTAENVADDISIRLQDKDGKWLKNWICEPSDQVIATIKSENWNKEGEIKSKNCGTFTVDEPEYSIAPGIFSLNAISIPANKNFKDVTRTKIWKKATVSKIAQTIASNSGLGLYYDARVNPQIDTKEQSNVSDMQFLQDLCSENGLILKIYSNKLIIFSESEYEQKPSVLTITKDMLTSATLKRSLTDCGYDGARLRYKKSNGVLITASFFPTGKASKVLELNDNVETQAEALKLCKAKLREKNKNMFKVSLKLPGLAPIGASDCITLKDDFGIFNGKYFLEKVSQSVSPTEYDLDAHKVLNGY